VLVAAAFQGGNFGDAEKLKENMSMHEHATAAPLVPRASRSEALNRIPTERQPSAMETEQRPAEPTEKATAIRRRHERRSAAITALVHSHGRFQTVSILDFSTGGLQLQGAFGVATGDQIEIELLSGHRLSAKVVWSLGSRIGAQFTPVLSLDHPGLVALQRTVVGVSDSADATREK
jgi:PilZ domain